MRRRRLTLRRPSGFTLVELATVAVVMGTLFRISIPGFHEVSLRARAAEVVADLEVVRVAVLHYHSDHHQWPPDAYTGQVPAGLAPYLPDGFTFVRAGYRLDWETWATPSGLPGLPDTRGILGLSIVTEDRALGTAAVELRGGSMATYTLGNTYTFIIERL